MNGVFELGLDWPKTEGSIVCVMIEFIRYRLLMMVFSIVVVVTGLVLIV